MASIHKEIVVACPPAKAWDAVRDVGEIHVRHLLPDAMKAPIDGMIEQGIAAMKRALEAAP
jgi:hypothetical protein